MAWVYVTMNIVFFAGSRVIAARVHTDTLAERGKMLDHAEAKQWDRTLSLFVGLLGLLAIYILAGLVHRFGWGTDVPLLAQLVALGVYVMCYVIGRGRWSQTASSPARCASKLIGATRSSAAVRMP